MLLDVTNVYNLYVAIVRKQCVVVVLAEIRCVGVMAIVVHVGQVSTEVLMDGLVEDVKNGIAVVIVAMHPQNANYVRMTRATLQN